MARYHVYIKATFVFDTAVEAENWSDAAALALKKYVVKNGIQDRMIKAFAPGEFMDGEQSIQSIYLEE